MSPEQLQEIQNFLLEEFFKDTVATTETPIDEQIIAEINKQCYGYEATIKVLKSHDMDKLDINTEIVNQSYKLNKLKEYLEDLDSLDVPIIQAIRNKIRMNGMKQILK